MACGRRFTTFERVEETPLQVVKRSGDRQPFDRDKVATGVRLAAKGRPIETDDDSAAIEALIVGVEDAIRLTGTPEVTTEAIGRARPRAPAGARPGGRRALRQRLPRL